MANETPMELFQWVKPLSMNDKIREALNPAKCLTEAAQIRTQADRISAAARGLAAGGKGTASVMPAIEGAQGIFGPMEGGYRGICGMLAGLANKELAANFTLTMPADRQNAEAHFWRSRVLADMLAASTYYKVTAELISVARKTLGKCSPSIEAGDMVLLLHHASALLLDAAKFMGTAGVELGDNDVGWKNLEDAVKQL
jgi:hypothetical protein